MVRGDRINTIPMLVSDEVINYKVGDRVEINGKNEFRRIMTSSGKLSFNDLPIIIPESYYQSHLE